MVKLKVKVGTLAFEQGKFSAGDYIEVTEDRAKLFDINDVEVIPEPAPSLAASSKPASPVFIETVEAKPIVAAPSSQIPEAFRKSKKTVVATSSSA